jgi:RNA polymerase sigma-70 factor (ECF subfamily)
MNGSGHESTHRAIERVARESYGRLVAYLSSHTRDVASAEHALSTALVAALHSRRGRETACRKIRRPGC